jgi:hypothetical protein
MLRCKRVNVRTINAELAEFAEIKTLTTEDTEDTEDERQHTCDRPAQRATHASSLRAQRSLRSVVLFRVFCEFRVFRGVSYLISHSCTFQKIPVFVGLPVKCCSDAGTASSLVMLYSGSSGTASATIA